MESFHIFTRIDYNKSHYKYGKRFKIWNFMSFYTYLWVWYILLLKKMCCLISFCFCSILYITQLYQFNLYQLNFSLNLRNLHMMGLINIYYYKKNSLVGFFRRLNSFTNCKNRTARVAHCEIFSAGGNKTKASWLFLNLN